MTKYVFNGKGIVWDGEANKPLARFKDGVFETEDGKTAGKLKKLGYEPTEVIKEKVEGGDPNGGGGNGNGAAG